MTVDDREMTLFKFSIFDALQNGDYSIQVFDHDAHVQWNVSASTYSMDVKGAAIGFHTDYNKTPKGKHMVSISYSNLDDFDMKIEMTAKCTTKKDLCAFTFQGKEVLLDSANLSWDVRKPTNTKIAGDLLAKDVSVKLSPNNREFDFSGMAGPNTISAQGWAPDMNAETSSGYLTAATSGDFRSEIDLKFNKTEDGKTLTLKGDSDLTDQVYINYSENDQQIKGDITSDLLTGDIEINQQNQTGYPSQTSMKMNMEGAAARLRFSAVQTQVGPDHQIQ